MDLKNEQIKGTAELETIVSNELYSIVRIGHKRIKVVVPTKNNGTLEVFLKEPRRNLEYNLIDYAIRSLVRHSRIIPFVLSSPAAMRLVEYLYRSHSRSDKSALAYLDTLERFSSYVSMSPDKLVSYCLDEEGVPIPKRVHNMSKMIDEFLGELEASGLASSTLRALSAHLKTFFRVNGIEVSLPIRYKMKPVYRDRAPTPEEIRKIMDVASLRDKAVIAMLATGGFRINTLLRLKYGHVREELEAGIVPLHVHVPAELNKGKVCDYDTFINEEAVYYLRLYIEQRKKGTEKIPPEELTDDSPLFRTYDREVKPLSYRTFKSSFNKYLKIAGLDRKRGKMREIRVHSLRKFFKTQMTALGAPTEYVEYMMGHKLSTYHDISMKGVEFLRQIYAAANIRIYPKEQSDLTGVLREIIKARGEDPAKYLKEEIISRKRPITKEEELEAYAKVIWEMLKREVLEGVRSTPENTSMVLYATTSLAC